jgi:hypothetical protein
MLRKHTFLLVIILIFLFTFDCYRYSLKPELGKHYNPTGFICEMARVQQFMHDPVKIEYILKLSIYFNRATEIM